MYWITKSLKIVTARRNVLVELICYWEKTTNLLKTTTLANGHFIKMFYKVTTCLKQPFEVPGAVILYMFDCISFKLSLKLRSIFLCCVNMYKLFHRKMKDLSNGYHKLFTSLATSWRFCWELCSSVQNSISLSLALVYFCQQTVENVLFLHIRKYKILIGNHKWLAREFMYKWYHYSF